MTVDIEKIISLTGEIEKSLTILKDYSEQQKEDIVSDLKVLGSIKYYLLVSIEACIDIANHIIAKEHLGVPKTYSDFSRFYKKEKLFQVSLLIN